MQLGAETVEHTECLKSWESGGLLAKIVDTFDGVDDFIDEGVDNSD